MKATKFIVGSLIILLFLYIFIINLIYSTSFSDFIKNNFTNQQENSFEENIGISDSVSVTIERSRWYGKIIIQDKNKELYLFGFLKIPLEKNETNYSISHLIFISIWSLILIITLIFHFALKDI